MGLFSSNENFSQLLYSPTTTTVQSDSTVDINAGVTSVADISDAYNTQVYRIDNSVRDNSTRLLDSLNTVFNAPSISTGGAASQLSGMGLDLGSFFNMPSTGSTGKLHPALVGGFFDSGVAQQRPSSATPQNNLVSTLVKLALFAAVVWLGFKLFKRFKK